MYVDLVCLQKCYQPVGTIHDRLCRPEERFDSIQIDGNEGWLKFFNAYHPDSGELVEAFGAADAEFESGYKPFAPEENGRPPDPSIEDLVKRFSKLEMVNRLKAGGLKVASEKWSAQALAKNIKKRQLFAAK